MTRLHSVVEGHTEEAFFNRMLVGYLSHLGVYPDVQLLSPKRVANRQQKGGWTSYAAAKRHLERWMKQDYHDDVWFTTMFDLYAIPRDFPDFVRCQSIEDPLQRVQALETAFFQDVQPLGLYRFVPYIQLHEFESLIFADPKELDWEFLEHNRPIAKLVQFAKTTTPEEINDTPTGAPSKRIIREIPEYEFRKASVGPLVADKIGLAKLRAACPHFAAWLTLLERLA